MRNNPPNSSKNRSLPYVRRSSNRITSAWMGMFNLVGLIYPLAWDHPDVHVRMTNRMCEQYGI